MRHRSHRTLRAGLAALATGAALLALAPPTHAVDPSQWALKRLKAEQAWQHSRGEGVIVAVLDSGVDATAPGLEGKVLPGADFIDGGDGREDPDLDRHGTRMAGFIAGSPTSGQGIWGVAPEAKILPVRVMGNTGFETQAFIKGVRFAIERGAKVINISLGGSVGGDDLTAAIAEAIRHDVVVVAAAGNSGNTDNQVEYPAGILGVVAVSATDRNDRPWPRSQHGPQVVLAAPGVRTVYVDGKGWTSGTSDSAAYVSGVAALVRAKYPQLTAGQVIERLVKTADDRGVPGRDEYYGYGIVNPVRALTANIPPGPAEGPLPQPSVPTPTPVAGSGGSEDSSLGLLVAALGGLVVVGLVAGVVVVLARRGKTPPPGPGGYGPPGPFPAPPARAGWTGQPPPPGPPGPWPPQGTPQAPPPPGPWQHPPQR
ncbi:type VII secretion-associated serine protease mycosin [Carbonactinospora thermoautotrophica]|uniref:type VII secretion-associated serine protease mycosin n=1 Tax=Carbonactinospora thermoautotrophica TaxID=1469144 RepID=UPI00227161BD|nr:type VII secretion-associated serine protease mycosin [Carbonactinospora thermoautotrophica]MCX9192629.1 type VII secretion-associated serine protease mycosin [Carbonactinospora thermoautotrophica]